MTRRWAAVAWLLWSCARPVPAPPVHATELRHAADVRPTRGRALLVGINQYKYKHDIADLRGCANDVENMRDVLISTYGFDPADIRVLLDHEATLYGITRAFEEHLIANAREDTVSVFYFSGHGSQIVDASGDEPDGWDETLVPHDSGRSAGHENRDLSDDVLNTWLQRINERTRHVAVILDACHSGTAVRAAGTPRAAPRDERGVPSDARSDSGDGASGFRPREMSYALISGSRAHEYSYERVIDGESHGALTWFLTRALRAAQPRTTFRTLMEEVKMHVTQVYPSQHPQLEGSERDATLFGLERIAPQPFVNVQLGGDFAELAAGRIHGITRRSEFALYPSTETDFDPAQSMATLQVEHVKPTTARASVSNAQLPLPAHGRAVERKRGYAPFRLKLAIESAPVPELRELRARLGEHTNIQVIGATKDYDVLVRWAEPEAAIAIEGGTSDLIAPLLRRGPGAVDRAVELILRWAKWYALAAIDNEAAAAPKVDLELEISGSSLRAGDRFKITLTNRSRIKLYVHVLDLSSDGSVSLIYPAGGAEETLSAGATWTKEVVTCRPEGVTGNVRDRVKVFLTAQPTDFSFVEQEALTRSAELTGPSDPLSELLATATGVRKLQRPQQIDTATWATSQREVEVLANPAAPPCR